MKLSVYLSKNLASFMSEHEIIEQNQKELYAYCFDFVLDMLVFHISILLVGFLLEEPLSAFIYLLAMTPTKMLAGGAHANSQTACSIISYTVALGCILSTAHIPQSVMIAWQEQWLVFVSCSIIIALSAPVDHPNKRLDTIKRKHAKKNCIIYLLFLALVYICFYLHHCMKYCTLMTVCMIIIVINQYIGYFTGKSRNRTKGQIQQP